MPLSRDDRLNGAFVGALQSKARAIGTRGFGLVATDFTCPAGQTARAASGS